MKISLPGNLDRYVADQVDSGRFTGADQMIATALETILRHDALRDDVEVGLNQFCNGDYVTIEGDGEVDAIDALADDIKTRGRQHLKESD